MVIRISEIQMYAKKNKLEKYFIQILRNLTPQNAQRSTQPTTQISHQPKTTTAELNHLRKTKNIQSKANKYVIQSNLFS